MKATKFIAHALKAYGAYSFDFNTDEINMFVTRQLHFSSLDKLHYVCILYRLV